jgi:hypothetical protein
MSALPSTGLPPSQYRFNYWPEDGQPGSTHIASFPPEFNDAQVGVIGAGEDGGDGHGDGQRNNVFLAALSGDILGDGARRGKHHDS